MDSRSPLLHLCHEAENKSQMPYHYSRRWREKLRPQFDFFRFRFHFKAVNPVHFPAGKSGNVIRGALGRVLRDTATPAAYARLFEPGSELGRAPSGLADWPRPFIVRAERLDGRVFAERSQFSFDLHIFDLRPAVLAYFREAIEKFAGQGVGPGHGTATLERVEQVDLEDRAVPANGYAPLSVYLGADGGAVDHVRLRFASPTELKSGGAVAPR